MQIFISFWDNRNVTELTPDGKTAVLNIHNQGEFSEDREACPISNRPSGVADARLRSAAMGMVMVMTKDDGGLSGA